MKCRLTVFTPTFNRGYVLENSYHALCRQTKKDFIWLIVDDGSTDDTFLKVSKWIDENIINIEYIKQENAGKQRAVNTGILNCHTDYFGFLDSDDYYCETTVEKIYSYLNNIDKEKKIAGILARRGINEQEVIGSKDLPQYAFVMNFDKLIRKYKFYGDTCRIYKTNVLKNFLYPIIEDKFILESVMLSAIDKQYDLLIVNEIFSISNYLNDGYTKNSERLYKNNPLGYALGIGEITTSKRGFFRQCKYVVLCTVWCDYFKIANKKQIIKNKILYYLLYPISKICYQLKVPKWIFRGESNG